MKKYISLLLLVLFFTQVLVAGGGWPQPKGSGYFKLFQWWVVSDQHFTDNGQIDPNVTSGIFNTGIYGEYGFTDRLTGVAYLPFFSRAYFNNTVSGTTGEVITPGESINSFGDAQLGLKYGLITKGPIAFSATAKFGLPLGNDQGGSMGNLQTGDGEFNQSLQIDAGKGFKVGKTNAYANAYIGYNNRSNGFSDEILYGFETGGTFFKNKIFAVARFVGVKSTNNGTSNTGENSTSIFANNSEHLSFIPEVAYNFNDKWGVSASIRHCSVWTIDLCQSILFIGCFFQFVSLILTQRNRRY